MHIGTKTHESAREVGASLLQAHGPAQGLFAGGTLAAPPEPGRRARGIAGARETIDLVEAQ